MTVFIVVLSLIVVVGIVITHLCFQKYTEGYAWPIAHGVLVFVSQSHPSEETYNLLPLKFLFI